MDIQVTPVFDVNLIYMCHVVYAKDRIIINGSVCIQNDVNNKKHKEAKSLKAKRSY